jgi:Protein of unknown function (DUF1592)/Protein of unknown function (DUF1588)/Protein of unknown function (DUF1585)/Protein of unknown function (DUF1587)/Protein of unknown function (DUF1595)
MKRSFPLLLLATALLQGCVFFSMVHTAQSNPSSAAPATAPSEKLASAKTGAAGADFGKDIAPALATYCVSCHSGEQPSGEVVLLFKDENEVKQKAAADKEFWPRVAAMLTSKQMPPNRAKNKPTDAQRDVLIGWINRDVLALDCGTPNNPGRFAMHRLNNREYANTIRDLLYLPEDWDASADFPADDRGAGFDNNSDTLTISPVLIEHYLDAAEKSANFAMNIYGKGSPASKERLNAPSANFKEDFADRQAKVRLNIQVFLPRAYRRPVSKEEIDEIMRFVAISFTHDGESFDKATNLAMRAALMSPEFLFRMERDPVPDGTGKAYQINEFELASRLSYFLWSSMPDDDLFITAQDGKLRENLDREVKRMLQDPKAISLTKDFMGQWLEIRSIEKTPDVSPELLASMKGETEHFFDYIIKADRSIMDFLDSDYTFVNETLANHYGIANVTGEDFQIVQVDPSERGGIFTQASFLTITSKPLEVKGGTPTRRTSPVNRGKWILENIFNETIPPPPPNVPPLAIDTGVELKGTVRQILEQHRVSAECAVCHVHMDPYGFALENYDGFGAWRAQDNKVNVDASGEINGHKFTNPREFRTMLASRRGDFRRAFVEKLFGYAMGRGVQDADKCAIDDICTAVEKDGDRFSSVILNLVKSYPFQHARGSALSKDQAIVQPQAQAAQK